MSVATIDSIKPSNLQEEQIWRRFRSGAQVVCLETDPRIQEICTALLERAGDSFWHQGIFDVARNHIPRETEFGDVFRFVHGEFGHFARKFALLPSSDGTEFTTFPIFHDAGLNGDQQRTFRLVWDVSMEVLRSAFSSSVDQRAYTVKIEILKYPNSAREYQGIPDLLSDTEGSWSRLGREIDFIAATAYGPFKRRYIRHIFLL